MNKTPLGSVNPNGSLLQELPETQSSSDFPKLEALILEGVLLFSESFWLPMSLEDETNETNRKQKVQGLLGHGKDIVGLHLDVFFEPGHQQPISFPYMLHSLPFPKPTKFYTG